MQYIMKSKSCAQVHTFDSLLPQEKEWYSTREAALVVGRTDEFIRGCCEHQEILHHRHGRKRKTYAIPRDGLLLYLLETASYDSPEYADRLFEIIQRRPADERERIAEGIAKIARGNSMSKW